MKKRSILIPLFTLVYSICVNFSCAQSNGDKVIYTGSTPADTEIRQHFRIAQSRLVDFIRWELTLNNPNAFQLNIHFGEGQPNTLGFKNGGSRLVMSGTYQFTTRHNQQVLKINFSNSKQALYLLQVTENLLHPLSNDDKLMVGNAGWSYTLTRKPNVASNDPRSIPGLRGHKFREAIFEGRTPCQELSGEYNFNAPGDCFKLKWKLTLLRNPYTKQPTTYSLSRTLERSQISSGKWRVVADTTARLTYIELDPDKKDKTLRLLAGDENVLFFLDKNNKLLPGNADFSYTLNRIKE